MTPLAASAIKEHSKDGVFNIQLRDGLIPPGANPLSVEGATAHIFAAKNPLTDSPLAIKSTKTKVNPKKRETHPFTREFTFLNGPLKGAPHSAAVRGICYSRKKIEIVMARKNGQDLYDLCIQQPHLFTTSTCVDIAKQIFEFLCFCHLKGVAHGDIKLANCIFNPETKELTVVDLGSAFWVGKESSESGGACTIENLAPEDLVGAKESGCPVDVWALGVLIFNLYTQSHLFDNNPGNGNLLDRKCLLALFERQFPIACPEYLGMVHLKETQQMPFNESKKLHTSADLQYMGRKAIPPLPQSVHSWYKTPWQKRIEITARKNNEIQHAPHLIALLEKIFVCNPEERITAEEGLRFLAKLRGESAPSVDLSLAMEEFDLGAAAAPEQKSEEEPIANQQSE